MKRNTTISISKAIAIIAMVVAHAECPSWLVRFIFEWHMPLFFIAAGYFFSLKYLDDEMTFIKKRFKGLYLPFVKWSVIFLLLHNIFFKIGLMNETYGNLGGGVLHPYSWHSIQQNLWYIVTYMGGYDDFICGAYWFFRALLVASILYLVLFKLVKYSVKDKLSNNKIAVIVTLIAFLLALWKCASGLTIRSLPQGGFRDLTGTFFFGVGFLFKTYEAKYKSFVQKNSLILFFTTLLFGCITVLFIYLPACMSYSGLIRTCFKLPLPAFCGWLCVYNISSVLDRFEGRLKGILCYCGDNTLYILLFHVLAFKLVSAVKILYYNLDWQQIGCHMVIHYKSDDFFWVIYSIVGVLVPLSLTRLSKIKIGR